MPSLDFSASELEAHALGGGDAMTALQLLQAEKTPTAIRELWHYTDFKPIQALATEWLSQPPATKDRSIDIAGLMRQASIDPRQALVFHNGQSVNNLDFKAPTGLSVEQASASPNLLERLEPGPLAALARATAAPITIRVAAEITLAAPIQLVNIVDGALSPFSNTALHIEVGDNADVQFHEHYVAAPETVSSVGNLCCSMAVGKRARVQHVRIAQSASSTFWIRDWRIALAANAHLDSLVLDFGAALGRNETYVRLEGEAAFARTAGVAVVANTDSVEHIAVMSHRAQHATSEQAYANVVADNASVVFNGKVYVAEGADGTDSAQSNRNLLLNDGAQVNTKPELEIYADDVKCAHGATTGRLDDNALFYLVSRGIPEREARDLLVRAFADPVLAAIANTKVRATVSDQIQSVLSALMNKDQTHG